MTGQVLVVVVAVMLSVYGVYKIGHGVKVLYHHTVGHIVKHHATKK